MATLIDDVRAERIRGNRRPYLDQALKLAKVLGVSLDYLADDDIDPISDDRVDVERITSVAGHDIGHNILIILKDIQSDLGRLMGKDFGAPRGITCPACHRDRIEFASFHESPPIGDERDHEGREVTEAGAWDARCRDCGCLFQAPAIRSVCASERRGRRPDSGESG